MKIRFMISGMAGGNLRPWKTKKEKSELTSPYYNMCGFNSSPS